MACSICSASSSRAAALARNGSRSGPAIAFSYFRKTRSGRAVLVVPLLHDAADTCDIAFRQSDTVGRYGGEEFVVILPETDISAGMQKLEAVRDLISCTLIPLAERNEVVQVTLSAGLSSFPGDGNTAAQLYAAADDRMFQAKREGRNRVIAAADAVLV